MSDTWMEVKEAGTALGIGQSMALLLASDGALPGYVNGRCLASVVTRTKGLACRYEIENRSEISL